MLSPGAKLIDFFLIFCPRTSLETQVWTCCISQLLLQNKISQMLVENNTHLLLLMSVRVKWMVLLIWPGFTGTHSHICDQLAGLRWPWLEELAQMGALSMGLSHPSSGLIHMVAASEFKREERQRQRETKTQTGTHTDASLLGHRLKTGEPSLLLHFVSQSQSQGQPRFKKWGNRLHLMEGAAEFHCKGIDTEISKG